MIAQAIAQIVDSYLTNSQKSREAATRNETNLNTNIGTGSNQSQLGGGNTASYINQQSGLGENVKSIAGAIGAGSKAHKEKKESAEEQAKKGDVSSKRQTPITGGVGGAVNKSLQNASGAGDTKDIGSKLGGSKGEFSFS